MDAAADYAAARAALSKTLPAYVSYTVKAHVKMDAITKDATQQVVVRTRDGKILKGNPGAVPGELDRPGMVPGPLGPTVPGIPGTRCCAGCSLDSVSCTVQARCSPVSTSKKPVRSKPRARQFSVPLMVNSFSREHM